MRFFKRRLPDFFKPILWSYTFEDMSPEKDVASVIVQAVNYGRLEHIRWIKDYYGTAKIEEVLSKQPKSAFRPQALALVTTLLNIQPSQHALRSITK